VIDNSKKRVLVTASTFPRFMGDATPPFVYELSKRLATDFEVHVLVPHSHGSMKYELIDGIHIHRYKFFPCKKLFTDGAILPNLKRNRLFYLQVPFFFLFGLLAMYRIIHRLNIDTIHAHWIIPQGIIAAIYKVLFNRKIHIIMTSHGGDVLGLQSNVMKWIKRWTVNKANAITVVSNALKKEVEELAVMGGIPIEVISMGVDLKSFHPDKYDDSLKMKYGITGATLLFAGRLTEKKGVSYLIEAMPEVLKRYPDAKLIIVGYGEEDSYLKCFAADLGLTDESIVFAGAVLNSELPRYYATADIFIGPSIVTESGDSEGFGLVFVEALGSGCAVIASDLPAIADIIIDNVTGFRVREKDSAEISEKIISLLEDKALREKVTQAGREHVLKNFDWEIVSRRYIDLMRS